MSAKVQHLHTHRTFSPGCTCTIISTDFKGLSRYKWIVERNKTSTLILENQGML